MNDNLIHALLGLHYSIEISQSELRSPEKTNRLNFISETQPMLYQIKTSN
jgi:hypothetical protein